MPHPALLPRLVSLTLVAAGLAACAVDQHAPSLVAVEPAAAIRAAGDASCALLANGNAGCWGANDRGQLGLAPSAQPSITVPTWLPLDADPSDLAVGPFHGCGVFGGQVSCWGENADGLLGGEGACVEMLSDGGCASGPVAVAGLDDAVAVAAAGLAPIELGQRPRPWTCALGGDGRAWCWGGRADGTQTPVFDGAGFPVRDLIQLAAAGDRACAADQAGALWCWTSGVDLTASRQDLPPVHTVAVGLEHACAVLSSGAVMCWGKNRNGQAGDVDAASACEPDDDCLVGPTVVPGVAGAVDVAVGLVHSCAATTDGAVACWGSNQTLQLGVGSVGLVSGPVAAAVPDTAVAVAAGRMHTCALGQAGAVWCWGDDSYGQVGVGD